MGIWRRVEVEEKIHKDFRQGCDALVFLESLSFPSQLYKYCISAALPRSTARRNTVTVTVRRYS